MKRKAIVGPGSMVAPKSREQQTATAETLYLVEDLACERNYAGWFVAGLRQATGWAPGKMVTRAEFDAAVARFSARPQGSGKI